ncbi:hypothetical protein C7374_11245 [Falsochrobactrum ovis]|uniref:Uncharacterized protein n=1 Tax=Falsochrobactrum ovis TaxID=1293442 RepID=A0A364JT65_9HYPH|nr:hypothetical protein C7374_11245 [Falsochrobactrum ovis]
MTLTGFRTQGAARSFIELSANIIFQVTCSVALLVNVTTAVTL